MQNLIQHDRKAFVHKTNRLKDVETKLMVTKGKHWGVVMYWEVAVGICTLLYTKLVSNNDLLYSSGKSTQYSVIAYMWGKILKKNVCIHTHTHTHTHMYG